jgi:WD40 repeat protein
LNHDHSNLAVACGDGTVRIFDANSAEEIFRIEAHQFSTNCVAFHPDNNYILSGGKDAYLKIWDAKSYTLIEGIPAHNYALYSVAFSPDKKYFATASRDKTFKIWDADTLEFMIRVDKEKHGGHKNSVNNILWMKNNSLVSTGDDRSVCVWEVGS